MSDDRERIDRITAEQLVSGARVGWYLGADPLTEVLAAAASPARPGELAGEEAAVMAFRAAHLGLTPESRRRSMWKSALAKVATVKAAAVLIAVAGGGAALAAGSGHLPGTGSNHHIAHSPAGSSTASEHASRASDPSHSAASEANESAEGTHAPSGSPSPNLRGLCTAFEAGVGTNPGKALDNPAFSVLIATAGGKDMVQSYCATVLASAPGKSSMHPSDAPSHPKGEPSHPTGAPSTHPNGAPSHPTGAPSSHPDQSEHPTGAPTHPAGH